MVAAALAVQEEMKRKFSLQDSICFTKDDKVVGEEEDSKGKGRCKD